MVYFLFSILYISLIISVTYFYKRTKLQDDRIISLIKVKENVTLDLKKLITEVEVKLKELEDTNKEYSYKLNKAIKTYDKYKIEWNNSKTEIKTLLHLFKTKHDNVEAKFKKKEQELQETFVSFKKMYEEMHFYLANSTRKLENRPEEVRRELLKTLENKQKQINSIGNQLSNFQSSIKKETNFLFRLISKLEDTTIKKDNSDFRY